MYFTLERWKRIKDFETEYVVSSYGKVAAIKQNRKIYILSQRLDRAGYMTVRLTKDGQTHTKFVHRLVAEAFVPNPRNKTFTNHFNGNKTDNRFINLEWVSHSENIKHAYLLGLVKNAGNKIIDSNSGKLYNSIKDAAKDLNMNYGTCRNYLNGNIKKNKTSLCYTNCK